MRKFLYFSAVWCAPCKLYGPVLKRVGNDFKDILIIEKVDIEEKQDLARKFNIVNVPTLVEVDSNNNELKRAVGAYPYDKVVQEFNLATS